jgi:hypothetical protein
LHKFVILAALLFVSFGFTSAYADDGILSDQSTSVIDSSLQSPDTMISNLGINTQDSTANMLAILLLGIPFGILVYRMSDSDPIPLRYAKLSGVVVAFAMGSMLMAPLATGNFYWGYALASLEPESNTPQPVDSLYFDTKENNLTINGATTTINQNNSAISLDGDDDYLVLDSALPSKLNEFTVSSWIKPDYKQGAPAMLSVVSEADAFDLSINNDKVDKNVAIFSVYDGIKWHKVQSKSIIPESWTHLSATYSGNEITIFVNGVQESSQKIDGDYSLTYQYGVPTQNSFDYISSKSDIIVGAFASSIRNNASVQNHFSGLIDDVSLYDKLLTKSQISAVDQNDRTPDTIVESTVQTIETTIEQSGIANEYGFVTDSDNPNDQKIEEVAAEGYKVKKPEETKKKKPAVTETAETILEFDESTVLIPLSKTTVCHIPEDNPDNAHEISINENALESHLAHGDEN